MNYGEDMDESTRLPQWDMPTQPRQDMGWQILETCSTWHFFGLDGRSLCRRWLVGRDTRLEPYARGARCVKCARFHERGDRLHKPWTPRARERGDA